MNSSILVIGGTRYFGIRLVERLLAAGHCVTLATRGRTPDPFGARVQRLRVDRRDPAAMRALFGAGTRYDLVYDQMCYSPVDAAIAAELFAGRVGRYLMTSTIEVYADLHGQLARRYSEDDIALGAEPLELDAPWCEEAFAVANYGRGKRQAEAVLLATTNLPAATLRLGHVLGGPEDFTGRLRRHVERVQRSEPLRHAAAAGASSFIDVEGAVDFLLWAGTQDFRGPINVAADGVLTAPQLHERIARCLGLTARCEPQALPGPADFDYAGPHLMDTARARALGFRFGCCEDWLDRLIDAHAEALAREEGGHAAIA